MSDPAPLTPSAEIEELLGAYALDAVDPDDGGARSRQHLDGCVRCAAEVGQHHEVAGLLANSGAPRPPGCGTGSPAGSGRTSDESWDRLAARLDAARRVRRIGAGRVRPAGRGPRSVPDRPPSSAG